MFLLFFVTHLSAAPPENSEEEEDYDYDDYYYPEEDDYYLVPKTSLQSYTHFFDKKDFKLPSKGVEESRKLNDSEYARATEEVRNIYKIG